MATDFLKELPDRLKEIHRLHAATQWPELKRAVHSLKGLFALFGLRPLSETLQVIEDAAGLADASAVSAALSGLDVQTEKAIVHLRDWRQNQCVAA